jgi:6-phospho-3-hexuloisomerase
MRTTEDSIDYLRKNFSIEEFTAPIDSHFKPWLDELNEELKEQSNKVNRILEGLLKASRIYTVGKGRSELVARTTGMRLMHEGPIVYRIGESYTPAIGNDPKYKDALFFVSGSGATKVVITAEEKAVEKNVPIYGVSSNINSEAVELAGKENVIITKGKEIYPPGTDVPPEDSMPINFLQTKSEMKALMTGELLINYIAKAKDVKEIDMKKRHANTE